MIFFRFNVIASCIIAFICLACNKKATQTDFLFEELPSSQTNISFVNKLESTPEMNIFSYRHFFNGGGVAIGDLDNNGLADV